MEESLDTLEEIQIKRLYFEYDEPLADIRVPLLRKLFYGLMMVLILAIIAGFFIVFPKTILTEINIKTIKVDAIYTFENSIYILEKYTKASNKVKKGDPLAKITSQKINELIHFYNQLNNEAKLLESSHDDLLPIENTILKTENAKIKDQIKNLEHTQNSIRRQWQKQGEQLNHILTLANTNYERHLTLFNQQVISKVELESYSKQLAEAQNAYSREKYNFQQSSLTYDNQIHSNYYLINENEKLSNKSVIVDSLGIKKNKLELGNLVNKLNSMFGSYRIEADGIVLLSPSDGVINYMFDGEKELPVGEALIRLKNIDNSFYAVGYVTSVNINKLKPNNKLFIKIEAFPFTEYGTIEGKIKNISKAPDLKGNYPFEIEIQEKDLSRLSLEQGMKGNAVIHLEEKTFWEHIFHKIKHVLSEKFSD